MKVFKEGGCSLLLVVAAFIGAIILNTVVTSDLRKRIERLEKAVLISTNALPSLPR